MGRKIEAVKRMIAFSRSVPDKWNEHDRLAKTTAGGMGIHAAILDIDIGPLLQVQKLVNSVRFARARGYTAPLSAAELELMNLTGDGNGFDMVSMPQALCASACRRRISSSSRAMRAIRWRAAPRRGGRPHRRYRRQDDARIASARRPRSRRGVLARAQCAQMQLGDLEADVVECRDDLVRRRQQIELARIAGAILQQRRCRIAAGIDLDGPQRDARRLDVVAEDLLARVDLRLSTIPAIRGIEAVGQSMM